MFNPNEHMMNLKGKDYLQVMWRLVWFREDHPDFGINTTALELTEDHAIFKAIITTADGVQVSAGHGSESKRDFGDFIEKAETKAIGRALAMLGYGTQFAADELDEGERIVDSPVKRAKNEPQDQETVKVSGTKNENSARIRAYCEEVNMPMNIFANLRSALVAEGIVPAIASNQMTEDQLTQLIEAVEERRTA